MFNMEWSVFFSSLPEQTSFRKTGWPFFLNKDDVGVRIYNADTGRFSTFGYGQIDFKYMPGGCRSDPGFHLIHVGS